MLKEVGLEIRLEGGESGGSRDFKTKKATSVRVVMASWQEVFVSFFDGC